MQKIKEHNNTCSYVTNVRVVTRPTLQFSLNMQCIVPQYITAQAMHQASNPTKCQEDTLHTLCYQTQ